MRWWRNTQGINEAREMNRTEFIESAVNSGYSSKKVAEQYADSRDSFTEADFIEVNRMYERYRSKSDMDKYPGLYGMKPMYSLEGRTTKRFNNVGSDKQ